VKTYYVNVLVLVKDFYSKQTFSQYEDKAVQIKEDEENKGQMLVWSEGARLFSKLRAGLNVGLAALCGSRERYDASKKECVACPKDSYSTALQAPLCLSCQDNYATLRDPATHNFQTALYSQACQDYITNRERNNCPYGANPDGSCRTKPTDCKYGTNPDGSCKPAPCQFG
jgi:hypothetical protein